MRKTNSRALFFNSFIDLSSKKKAQGHFWFFLQFFQFLMKKDSLHYCLLCFIELSSG